ncbi:MULTISPECIES: HIT family protein [Lactobacillaceae]|uniref:HIT family protein n=1 Tax=Lactobacillaceae TaxID=33958 RepID=UPI000C1B7969|nr:MULTISPECIES: HIT family protein [Lactobacillaceae]
MDNCIFCKIINNEIPSYTIYEDDDVKVFLDISQVTPGHTLMVPKKHVENIFEYDSELSEKVLTKIPMIAKAIKKSDKNIEGMNIAMNNGEVAYQTVMHSHIHFVPKFTLHDDFAISFKDNTEKYTSDQLEQILNNIKENL